MAFHSVEKETWERKEYFDHYFTAVPCTYSMTVKLDVTHLVNSGERFYPAMLYCLSKAVNRHQQFKMTWDQEKGLGWYDMVHPSYTIFHPDTETFSCLWTPYQEEYSLFRKAYEEDQAKYGDIHRFLSRTDTPANTFSVSMIPWESFDSFNLNLQNGYDYLPPIFTMGRYREENGKILLPLSIQVHHAVCDGFHVCRLVKDLREILEEKFWEEP